MRDLSSGLSELQKRDLLATVIDESERLNRFIANLLDMTKLESGAIVPNTARHDIGEIVGSALRRASKILVRHKVSLELAADLPMLELDAVLFEQVLFNVLDNAAKYAHPDTTISIRSSRENDAIVLQILDDEPPIRKLLRMGLTTQGYEILEASNGRNALELLAQDPALIILDLGLPDIQGHELLRMIRGRNDSVPVVVLSSRGDEAGKVQALDLGADDYLTKPFGMDELLARMRAALRHQLQVHGERPVFRSGDLSVDLVRRIVKVADKDIKLSPKEYELLRVLVQHAGKVLTHRFLLKELWDELTDAQYLRVYVRQLRQKIEADPERPQFVLTETGIGYRLRAAD